MRTSFTPPCDHAGAVANVATTAVDSFRKSRRSIPNLQTVDCAKDAFAVHNDGQAYWDVECSAKIAMRALPRCARSTRMFQEACGTQIDFLHEIWSRQQGRRRK